MRMLSWISQNNSHNYWWKSWEEGQSDPNLLMNVVTFGAQIVNDMAMWLTNVLPPKASKSNAHIVGITIRWASVGIWNHNVIFNQIEYSKNLPWQVKRSCPRPNSNYNPKNNFNKRPVPIDFPNWHRWGRNQWIPATKMDHLTILMLEIKTQTLMTKRRYMFVIDAMNWDIMLMNVLTPKNLKMMYSFVEIVGRQDILQISIMSLKKLSIKWERLKKVNMYVFKKRTRKVDQKMLIISCSRYWQR